MSFDSQRKMIVRQPASFLQSSQSTTQSEDWGSWNQDNPDELSGRTISGNMQFSIKYDASTGLVTCALTPIQQSQRLRSVALGSLLGTLTGLAAGAVAGSLAVGLLAGLTAAVTGSIVASSDPGVLFGSRTDSSGTWVANDGSGTREIKPAPYTLKSVSA
jgi:hypothetical protein